MANASAFIIDDTTDARVGRHLENVSYVFDHVIRKTRLGFKDLVLGYFDVVIPYEGVGDVTLYLCRFPYQKPWRDEPARLGVLFDEIRP